MWPFNLSALDRAKIDSVVKDFVKDIPPDLTKNSLHILSVNKTTRVIERLIKDFKEFDSSRKLGYFRRVIFFNDLNWKMREVGYSKNFVDLVLESLLSGTFAKDQIKKKPTK